jgi:hypothetical protein
VKRHHPLIAALALGIGSGASASFQTYFDQPSWEGAVQSYTALTFADLGGNAYMTDQYAHLGVTFLNGDDFVEFGSEAYPQNGWGIDANANCHLKFDFDVYAIAVWHPGNMGLKLYNDGQLVYSFPFFPGGGYNWFGGVVGTVPFDEVIIYDWFDSQISIDDIYFAPVPAPGAAVLLLAVALFAGRRRAGRCAARGAGSRTRKDG